jgi:hypothetical protein
MKKINARLYKTDGSTEPLVLTPKTRLKTLQKLVGGYIQVIQINHVYDDAKKVYDHAKDLVLNEEGKLLNLPINPWSAFVTIGSKWCFEEFRGDIILIEGKLP